MGKYDICEACEKCAACIVTEFMLKTKRPCRQNALRAQSANKEPKKKAKSTPKICGERIEINKIDRYAKCRRNNSFYCFLE